MKKTSSSRRLPLKRGNITLLRLLIIVNSAGPEGISTMKLFQQIGSTGYGQTVVKRAVREGLIQRKEGESEHGQFAPVYNIITQRGKDLLASHEFLSKK